MSFVATWTDLSAQAVQPVFTDDQGRFERIEARLAALEGDQEEGTWVPTLTNFTADITTAAYVRLGNLVYCQIRFDFDATPAGGTFQFSYPFPKDTTFQGTNLPGASTIYLNDVSTGAFHFARISLGTALLAFHHGTSEAAERTSANATSPFTWASGDIIFGAFWYKRA
jgi:hypothetical protein